MELTNLTKENVMFHLINFSKNKWLNSEYFCNNLVQPVNKESIEGKKLLEKVQRELAKVISELIKDMQTLQDERRIVSCGEGYKIATTPEEIKIGRNYLYSKIEDVLKRIKWLEDGYNKMLHKKDLETLDIFL